MLGGAHVFRWFFCGGPPWDGHHFFCAAAAARGGCTASPPTHRRFYCLGAGLLVAPARGGAPGEWPDGIAFTSCLRFCKNIQSKQFTGVCSFNNEYILDRSPTCTLAHPPPRAVLHGALPRPTGPKWAADTNPTTVAEVGPRCNLLLAAADRLARDDANPHAHSVNSQAPTSPLTMSAVIDLSAAFMACLQPLAPRVVSRHVARHPHTTISLISMPSWPLNGHGNHSARQVAAVCPPAATRVIKPRFGALSIGLWAGGVAAARGGRGPHTPRPGCRRRCAALEAGGRGGGVWGRHGSPRGRAADVMAAAFAGAPRPPGGCGSPRPLQPTIGRRPPCPDGPLAVAHPAGGGGSPPGGGRRRARGAAPPPNGSRGTPRQRGWRVGVSPPPR